MLGLGKVRHCVASEKGGPNGGCVAMADVLMQGYEPEVALLHGGVTVGFK